MGSLAAADHLARAIRLSYCYLAFYFVQMAFAVSLCSMIFFNHLEWIPFVEIPLAFFILFDM